MKTLDYYFVHTDLTIETIGKELGLSYKQTFSRIAKAYTKEERRARKAVTYRNSKLGAKNPMLGKFPERHPNYIGAVSDGKGYLMTVKPDWYTGRAGSKHVFVHQLVVCEALGITAMPPGHCVHHCDQNPLNNDYSNLILLTSGEHMSLHAALAGATTISKESTAKWLEARRAGLTAMI